MITYTYIHMDYANGSSLRIGIRIGNKNPQLFVVSSKRYSCYCNAL